MNRQKVELDTGITFEVYFIYEKEEQQSLFSPGQPECITIEYIYFKGTEIYDLLRESVIEEIEQKLYDFRNQEFYSLEQY